MHSHQFVKFEYVQTGLVLGVSIHVYAGVEVNVLLSVFYELSVGLTADLFACTPQQRQGK